MVNQAEFIQTLEKARTICINAKKTDSFEKAILSLLFCKYLTDIYKAKTKEIREIYCADKQKAENLIDRISVEVHNDFSFDYFYANINDEKLVNIVCKGFSEMNNNLQNNIMMYALHKALNFEMAQNQLKVLGKQALQQLLFLFHSLDLTGREEYNVMNVAYKYFFGYFYTFKSFRETVGI